MSPFLAQPGPVGMSAFAPLLGDKRTPNAPPMPKKTALIAATAAAMFAAGSIASVARAHDGVKCSGINSCKGPSACKTATSACTGMNACKGQGWVSTKDAAECTSKGGKVI